MKTKEIVEEEWEETVKELSPQNYSKNKKWILHYGKKVAERTAKEIFEEIEYSILDKKNKGDVDIFKKMKKKVLENV